MLAPPVPHNERERLEVLKRLDIQGAVPDERCQRYARLARRLLGTSSAAVTIVGPQDQWFRGSEGLPVPSTPRAVSFCGHAILQRELFHVADAAMDQRFADNPLVTGEPRIRFYAGCPLVVPGGLAVGTLCVIDRAPRVLASDERAALRDLADCLESELATLYAVADMKDIADDFFGMLPGRAAPRA